MPHPSKTSQAEILAAALALVESRGPEGLSMRAIARRLGLATNALYPHYPNRGALEDALALEARWRILRCVERATAGRRLNARYALELSGKAYLRFARQ